MDPSLASEPSAPLAAPSTPVPYTPEEIEEMMAVTEWQPPSRWGKLLSAGLTLTIRVTPTAIVIWMLAGEETRYEVRKLARWIPWGVRYAAWWLRQERE
jgi:hypothetical protein